MSLHSIPKEQDFVQLMELAHSRIPEIESIFTSYPLYLDVTRAENWWAANISYDSDTTNDVSLIEDGLEPDESTNPYVVIRALLANIDKHITSNGEET